MNTVKMLIELNGRDIKIACSQPDAGMIILLLEKAKLKVLNGIELQERSNILTPTNGLS